MINYDHCIGVVDIETSGFIHADGQILEIGICALDLRDGSIHEIFDSMCFERKSTKEHFEKSWIVQNGFIALDEIRNAPHISKIKNEVQAHLDKFKLGMTAYNISFDFDFLEKAGFQMPFRLKCPMRLSTPICKIPSRQSRYSNSRNNYKWPKAEEAFNFFFNDSKPDYVELHRGLDDAKHEAKIVYELYKRGVFVVDKYEVAK